MVLVPLLAAPSLMLATTAAERRFGAAVAGTIAAAPIVLSVIVLAVGTELGRDAGATLAAGAAAHVVAQVAFALVFATTVTRRGGPSGLLAGVTAFTLVSLLVELVPLPLAIAAAFPTLLLAPHFLKGSDSLTTRSHKKPCSERNRFVKGSDPLIGAVAATALVGGALGTAAALGPAAAGAVGAFPALSATFAFVLVRSRGAGAAAAALGGLIGGLRAYLVFCLTVVVVAPAFGVVVAVPLALGACLTVYPVLLVSSRSRRPSC
jgi:hypothetical protein